MTHPGEGSGDRPVWWSVGTSQRVGERRAGLVVFTEPVTVCAFFTESPRCASAVTLSREHLARSAGSTRAIFVVSGASDFPPESVTRDRQERLVGRLADHLGCEPVQVLVATTGPIGAYNSEAQLDAVLSDCLGSLGSRTLEDFAEAIRTTDTFAKFAAERGHGDRPGGGSVRGVAKGSTMIQPQLHATLIGLLLVDRAMRRASFERVCGGVVADTFNTIDVDGTPSPNDSVFFVCRTRDDAVPETAVSALSQRLRAVAYALSLQVAGDEASPLYRVACEGLARRTAERLLERLLRSYHVTFPLAVAEVPTEMIQVVAAAHLPDPPDIDVVDCTEELTWLSRDLDLPPQVRGQRLVEFRLRFPRTGPRVSRLVGTKTLPWFAGKHRARLEGQRGGA